MKNNALPPLEAYQKMTFAGMEFLYSSEVLDYEHPGNEEKRRLAKYRFEYIKDFSDTVSLYQNDAGQRAVGIFSFLPTFDSGDREWDSYRRILLIPLEQENRMEAFLDCGGYRLAKSYYYPDIRFADEKTEQKLTGLGAFPAE